MLKSLSVQFTHPILANITLEFMNKKEFKAQIGKMTLAQKKKWYEINTRLVAEVNEKDFKSKTAYKNAMAKVYDKTIAEYLKSQK
jgi:hypothetical protein